MELFEPDWGVNEDPIENVEITQVLLYYDRPDVKLFKKLCKEGIKDKFSDFINQGSISELLLILLKEKYGNESV